MIKGLRASRRPQTVFWYVAHKRVMVRYSQAEDIAKYVGLLRRPAGTTYREAFARQKETGSSATTRRWPSATRKRFLDVGAWDDLDDDTKAVFARYMEVYAASIESVDEIWAPSRRCRGPR